MKLKKERIGKAALAKSNAISINIDGIYEDDRQKFQSVAQDLAITFDGNNNVLVNGIKSDVTDNTTNIGLLQTDSHTHTNQATLDILTATYISELENKVAALASILGATFNIDGTLATETYTAHTHGGVTTGSSSTTGVE
jgi:hypothetical protein